MAIICKALAKSKKPLIFIEKKIKHFTSLSLFIWLLPWRQVHLSIRTGSKYKLHINVCINYFEMWKISFNLYLGWNIWDIVTMDFKVEKLKALLLISLKIECIK